MNFKQRFKVKTWIPAIGTIVAMSYVLRNKPFPVFIKPEWLWVTVQTIGILIITFGLGFLITKYL